MKKLIAILLVLTMVLSLAACGGDSGSNGTTPGGDKDPPTRAAPRIPQHLRHTRPAMTTTIPAIAMTPLMTMIPVTPMTRMRPPNPPRTALICPTSPIPWA